VTCFRPESNRGPYGLLHFLSAALSTTELWWRMNHRKSFRTLFGGYFAGSILSFLGFEDPTYYDFDILGRVWRTYSHRVVMCDFQHVYIHLSSPRGSIIVNKCHKWPWHERVLSRTFVVSEIVKTYEILVYEHVVFFAILSSIQGLLFGYMWSNLAMFLSFFLSWGLKTQPNHWTKRTVNTQLRI